LKTTIIYLKDLLNVQVPIHNFYFKFLSMCNFAHDRQGRPRQFGGSVIILRNFHLKINLTPLIVRDNQVVVKYMNNGLNMTFIHKQMDIYL